MSEELNSVVHMLRLEHSIAKNQSVDDFAFAPGMRGVVKDSCKELAPLLPVGGKAKKIGIDRVEYAVFASGIFELILIGMPLSACQLP